MVDLDEFALSKLARELGMNIRNYKAVFADFGITEEDYYEIEKIAFYRRAKEHFTLEWNSALSAADRSRLISAAYIEATLPTVGKRMMRESEPLSQVIDAGKYLAKIAGIGEAKAGPNANERFVITINIGNETETYNKSVAVDARDCVDITPGNAPNKVAKSPSDVAFAAFTAPDNIAGHPAEGD